MNIVHSAATVSCVWPAHFLVNSFSESLDSEYRTFASYAFGNSGSGLADLENLFGALCDFECSELASAGRRPNGAKKWSVFFAVFISPSKDPPACKKSAFKDANFLVERADCKFYYFACSF
jgi:hypothetical protein